MASRKHTTPAVQLDLPLPHAQLELLLGYPPEEHWRAVVDYEGLYEVSTWGRIRRLYARVKTTGNLSGWQWVKGRMMRTKVHSRSGYVSVILCKDGIPKGHRVHVLVLSAFVGVRPDGYVVNHIDANRSNNMIDNLEWVTPSQNQRHAFHLGRKKAPITYHRRKLTEAQVQDIRELASAGMTYAALGRRYSVNYTTISAIVHFRTWKSLS